MSELRELYQQVIIDHGRNPRNFYALDKATHMKEGFNPLCGDKVTIYLIEKKGVLTDVSFSGCGCAISMASASMMTEVLKEKSLQQVAHLFDQFHELVTGVSKQMDDLGKLRVLAGVKEYPVRVKCATLCWHTLQAALKKSQENISTE